METETTNLINVKDAVMENETALRRFTKDFFSYCIKNRVMPSKSSFNGFQFLYYKPFDLMKKTYKSLGFSEEKECFIVQHNGVTIFKTQDANKDAVFEAYNSCALILDKMN